MLCVDSSDIYISESSSRGNQLKFRKDNKWIKIDNQFCHEGLAEDFISKFESCILGFNFVDYKSETINYNGIDCIGCYSYTMYNNSSIAFISLRQILRSLDLNLSAFHKYEDVEDNIKYIADIVYKSTEVDILNYLCNIILLDSLIINEDRHWMNLGVCFNGSNFIEAPCFDNGSSLFCTNWTYRKYKTLDENLKSAESIARPFSKFYSKQVNGVLKLDIKPLEINKSKLEYLIVSYKNELYPKDIVDRVKTVLVRRLNLYEGVSFNYV